MAIRHRNNEIVEKNNLSDNRGPRKNKKNPWPTNETGSTSPSWDGNSRSTSSSWPEDIEEAATRKVLNLWCAIERTLYKEDEQVPLGNIMDECIQWRTQIPHFRVVGTKKSLEIEENDSEGGWSGEYKSHCSTDIRHIDHDNERNNSQQTVLNIRINIIFICMIILFIWLFLFINFRHVETMPNTKKKLSRKKKRLSIEF